MSSTRELPPTADRIEALIEGQVRGQIAVGKHILQVGPVYGGVVHIAPPDETANKRLRPRARPVRLLPRAAERFLDREAEVETLINALKRGSSVDLYAREGTGKTTLLRRLAHAPPDTPLPDGIAYLSARHLAPDDFLHDLLMAFYESDVPVRLTRSEIRARLSNVRALILVDDVEWSREDAETLLDAAPQATFLLTGRKRHLWGESTPFRLQGLPRDAAISLLEQELGRSLDHEEQDIARALVDALGGHPLSIVQIAGQVAEGGLTLKQALAHIRSDRDRPDRGAAAAAFSSLSEEDRRLLSALAALRGMSLDASLLGAIAGIPQPQERLSHLERRGFVQSHSPRYTVAANVADAVAAAPTLAQWQARAADVILGWARDHAHEHARLAEQAPAHLFALNWLASQGRWEDVLSLARALDVPLSLHSRWEAWHQVLQRALEAARHLGDRAAEAWALHQLGTRALLLGDKTGASWLREALSLRERLGDRTAAAVTRHNLNVFFPPPPPPAKPSTPVTGGGLSLIVKSAVGLVLVTAVALAGLRLLGSLSKPEPPKIIVQIPSPPPSPTVSLAHTFTPTPTFTSTPTFTPTPTLTPTFTPPPTHTPTPTWTPRPQVGITTQEGCDREVNVGTIVSGSVKANVDGRVIVTVWVNREPIKRWEVKVSAGKPTQFFWELNDTGTTVFVAQLLDASDKPVAEARCPIFVRGVMLSPLLTPTVTPTPIPQVLFDFVAEAAQAEWSSGAGMLKFPGSPVDERGFALWRKGVYMEDGTYLKRVLETHPEWVPNGYIQGLYFGPRDIRIQSGDRFVARVGLLKGAGAGDVRFQVWFDTCSSNEFPFLLGEIRDTYDGQVREWVIPLDEYAGMQGCFTLKVHAGESSAQDWAAWVVARIERP